MIIASARLSWAVTIAGGLLWVYALSALTFGIMFSMVNKKYFPEVGKYYVFICVASFWGGTYLLLLWLLCPLAAIETFLPLLLIPMFCAGCGIYERITSPLENMRLDIFDHISDAVSQAAILATLTIVFSIVREPLAYCSLSLPGSSEGMVTIMFFRLGSFFPIGIFASSAGALLLLGYFICLYQYGKNAISGRY
jgi:hypothetical protein